MKQRYLAAGAVALALVSIVSPLTAAAEPKFLSYEGRNSVREGDGGERETVDGVDFWMRGAPPRKFQVIGSLSDRRHASGLVGKMRMSALDHDIAKATRAAGGDAVILESEDRDVVGSIRSGDTNFSGYATPGGSYSGNASSFGISRPIVKHDARYIVVRYLAEEVTAPPTSQSPASAQ